MTTVDRVKAVCKSKKIAISTLEKDLGYSNGYIGKLKKGALPDDRLVDIAKYLNVSVSYLIGWDDAITGLNKAGMSEIDVAQEMGIDPSVLNNALSGNDASSATAVSKFVRVATVLSDQKEKSPAPDGVGLDPETIELRNIWGGADKEEREALLAMARMLKARRDK